MSELLNGVEAPAVETANLDQERLAKIVAQRHVVAERQVKVWEAEGHLESAKGTLKYAEKQWEQAVTDLCETIDEKPAEPTLFDGAPDNEAWRVVTLAELQIEGAIAEKLTEAGLTTLGAIADHTGADKKLIDVPGIGPASAEKIEAAMDAYWAANPPPLLDTEAEREVDESELGAATA